MYSYIPTCTEGGFILAKDCFSDSTSVQAYHSNINTYLYYLIMYYSVCVPSSVATWSSLVSSSTVSSSLLSDDDNWLDAAIGPATTIML